MRLRLAALILTLALGLLLAPLAADAQQAGKVWRIGVLSPVGSPADNAPYIAALKGALRELGWIEGQSVAFEERYPAGKPELLPILRGTWCASKWTSSSHGP